MTRPAPEEPDGHHLWRATIVILLVIIALPTLMLVLGCLAVPFLAVVGALFGGGA